MLPVALTIAGSDSGGGAGIQADLKAFARLEVHGATAITCITAQNRKAVLRLEPCPPELVRAQIKAVFAQLRPRAAKTGVLYSTAIIREVVRFFEKESGVPLVVDPVMVATSGRVLLLPAALRTLQRELLPMAALVTPNLAEAEVLTGRKIRSTRDMRAAARAIRRQYGCPALVKGGHCDDGRRATDFLCTGQGEWVFSTPRVKHVSLHGAGCAYSAVITAWLARGRTLREAVERAKEYIYTDVVRASKANQPP
jgi:hydroxymethylpyrimidine/phosphomethylpyrimidine kinase